MTQNNINMQFEELFNKYSSMVYRTAYFLTKSKYMADDITQETFIRIMKKFHLYNPEKPIEPWIYRITMNITRNMIRKQKLLNIVGVNSQGIEEVEDKILKSEQENELWEEINHLSYKSKEVIVLHYYSELTLEEVAETLKIPIGTCKSRLNYGLEKLRKSISKKEFFQIEQILKEEI